MSDRPEATGHPETRTTDRLPYARPRLGRVRLQAEQTLATGCKTDKGGQNSGFDNACTYGPCGSIQGTAS